MFRPHIHLLPLTLAGMLLSSGVCSAGWLNRAPGAASGWVVDGRSDFTSPLSAGVTQLIQSDNSNVWVAVTNGQVVVTTVSNWIVYAVITNITPAVVTINEWDNYVVTASTNATPQVGDVYTGPPWVYGGWQKIWFGPGASPSCGWYLSMNLYNGGDCQIYQGGAPYGRVGHRIEPYDTSTPVGHFVNGDGSVEVTIEFLNHSAVTNVITPAITNFVVTANVVASGVTTNRQVWATLDELPLPATYPVITLPIGGGWSDFILKASTDNFATVCWKVESAGGTPNHVPDPGAMIFYTDDYATDSRQWLQDPVGASILSLLANANSVVSYVVVSPSHNCVTPWQAWMYEGNANLKWSYCRVNGTGLEMNVDVTAVRWQVPASVVWKTKQVQL